MIEELATVTAIDGENITVESQIKSSCSGCQQVDNCASGQVAKAIPHRKLTITMQADARLNVGECIVIGIPEDKLLTTAMQVYLYPLIGLLTFSAVGQWLVQANSLGNEFFAVFLGVLGGYAGHIFAKRRLSSPQNQRNLAPIFLRKAIQTISVT